MVASSCPATRSDGCSGALARSRPCWSGRRPTCAHPEPTRCSFPSRRATGRRGHPPCLSERFGGAEWVRAGARCIARLPLERVASGPRRPGAQTGPSAALVRRRSPAPPPASAGWSAPPETPRRPGCVPGRRDRLRAAIRYAAWLAAVCSRATPSATASTWLASCARSRSRRSNDSPPCLFARFKTPTMRLRCTSGSDMKESEL